METILWYIKSIVKYSEVKVVLANKENANIIKNIYPLYLYDLSEVYGNVPNEYGIYEDEHIKTLIVAPSGTNPRAEKFWRKTISDYTNGNFEEKHDVTFDGYKLIFTFK